MDGNWLASAISGIALLVSGLTLWLVHFRRGKILMTRPTQIYLGPDGGRKGDPKALIHALLYSNAKRGAVLENMYVRLSRGQTKQTFSIWVHGDRHSLRKGSGLFVNEVGVSDEHHFLLPPDGASFEFSAGIYQLEIFGNRVGETRDISLFSKTLEIDKSDADRLRTSSDGIYFDWGPHTKSFHGHIGNRPNSHSFMKERFPELASKLEKNN